MERIALSSASSSASADLDVRVSIIIPTRNEQSQIVGCLDSAWAARPDEVIVVDGGSCDATVERAAAHTTCVLFSETGRGIQQNAGAAKSTGDILLFLHADNRLAPDAVGQIKSLVRTRPGPICGAFRQKISKAAFAYRLIEWGNSFRAGTLGIPYGDQSIFLSRELFDSVGGFPAFPIMEDIALMWQIRRVCRPHLLKGPIYVSPRRWEKHGLCRQTLRNWAMATAWILGADPQRLAKFYAEKERN